METQAKRQYKEISERLLKGEKNNLAERLEILRLFLESANFNKLRSESESHMVEGENVKFIVHREGGKPVYKMEVIKSGDNANEKP